MIKKKLYLDWSNNKEISWKVTVLISHNFIQQSSDLLIIFEMPLNFYRYLQVRFFSLFFLWIFNLYNTYSTILRSQPKINMTRILMKKSKKSRILVFQLCWNWNVKPKFIQESTELLNGTFYGIYHLSLDYFAYNISCTL